MDKFDPTCQVVRPAGGAVVYTYDLADKPPMGADNRDDVERGRRDGMPQAGG